jgi:hypothetical protein
MPPKRRHRFGLNRAENFSVKNKAPKFPLPKPMELAKLAAILRPDFKPKAALEVAMEFYVEALLFSRELPSAFQEVVLQFRSEERTREITYGPLKKLFEASWADTLELDPKKDDDPARQYLARQGVCLKKAQSVLDKFRDYYDAPLPKDTYRAYSRPSANSMIARCERVTEGRKTYAMPKFMLDNIIRYAMQRRREDKRRSWHTRKAAKKPPVKNAQGES